MTTTTNKRAALFGDLRGTLLEGAIVDPRNGRLYLVDIDECKLHIIERATGNPIKKAYDFDRPISSVSLTTDPDWVVVTLGSAVRYFNLESEEFRTIAEDIDGAGERLNDCRVVDWNGTIKLAWGGIDRSGEGKAAFGVLDADGTVTKLLDGIGISNGLAVLYGQILLYVDSMNPETAISKFVIADDGSLQSGEEAKITLPAPSNAAISPAVLDGLWLDEENGIWVAVNAASCVLHVCMYTGKILETIDVPTPEVTTLCIDHRGTMFITTARERHEAQDPPIEADENAGRLYSVKLGKKGKEPKYFPAPA